MPKPRHPSRHQRERARNRLDQVQDDHLAGPMRRAANRLAAYQADPVFRYVLRRSLYRLNGEVPDTIKDNYLDERMERLWIQDVVVEGSMPAEVVTAAGRLAAAVHEHQARLADLAKGKQS